MRLFPIAVASCLALLARPALAQVGSSNVAAIEPPTIPHPATTPCVVTLFEGAAFGANAVPYAYAPPKGCPGPWAKVVLATDISVEAGRQFDRTGTIWLDGVNLWFGTTAEPRAALAPNWHVERDVTDDTALLLHAGTGHVLIANYQSAVYTSTITARAELRFYPPGPGAPAPRVPDMVIGFGNDAGGDTVALNTGADALSRTLTLPGNIERAAFDALLQGQNDDEFWYTCVPDALAAALQSCGGGAFREGELAIDGKPAGIAPVFPVVFTGGIDPYLWEPIPDVSTLDLKPFRVELTPFAGMLDATGTHTISLSVANANDYFSVTGTLYLWLDHGTQAALAGTLVSDTLGASPSPSVTTSQGTQGSDTTATVDTVSNRRFSITGRLATSHGPVTTTVAGTNAFSNRQSFDIGSANYLQDVVQDTETNETVTTASASGTAIRTEHFSFPIALSTSLPDLDAATFHQATTIAAGYLATAFGTGMAPSLLAEAVASKDTIAITGNAITGHAGGESGALYAGVARDGCVARVLGSYANVLEVEREAGGCGAAASVARQAMSAAGMRVP